MSYPAPTTKRRIPYAWSNLPTIAEVLMREHDQQTVPTTGPEPTIGRRWRDNYEFLRQRGYVLPPRYRPGWGPPSSGTEPSSVDCPSPGFTEAEDNSVTLEAWKYTSRKRVTITIVPSITEQLTSKLATMSLEQARSPKNCRVPILEYFTDPEAIRPETFIVQPFLDEFLGMEFNTVGEVLDFVEQTLEGLSFMHEKGYAYRSITVNNIKYETVDSRAPDDKWIASYSSTRKFYLVNLEDSLTSTRNLPGAADVIQARLGFTLSGPFQEAFRLLDLKNDVYELGVLYLEQLIFVYAGLDELLAPLISCMVRQDISTPRVSAAHALDLFRELTSDYKPPEPRNYGISVIAAHWEMPVAFGCRAELRKVTNSIPLLQREKGYIPDFERRYFWDAGTVMFKKLTQHRHLFAAIRPNFTR